MAFLASTAAAARPFIDITPMHINFGNQRFETFTKQGFTIANRSNATIVISVESIINGR